MRILLVAPNWIGDAVMSLSLIQALAADARCMDDQGGPPEIHVLAPAVTAPVYEFSAAVHSVQAEPFTHGQLQWRLRKQVAHALRAQQFDWAIVLPNSLKSALVPYFAKIPKRTGYNGELRTAVLNQALPKPSKHNKPPMMEWYGRLGGYSVEQLQIPQLQVPQQAQQDSLTAFNLQPGFLALAPGAEYGPAKRWPAEHFAQVADAYLQLHPAQQVVILGGPKDVEFSKLIADRVDLAHRSRVQVLAGQTRLPQAMALMCAASTLVTNDSGLMHVGAALNVKVQAVFGSSSPHHTPPLNPTAEVHYLGLPCSPCFERQCPLGHTHCLTQLLPQRVIDRLPVGQEHVLNRV